MQNVAGAPINNVPDRLQETCSGDQGYAEYFARPKRFACPNGSGTGSDADFRHEDNAKKAQPSTPAVFLIGHQKRRTGRVGPRFATAITSPRREELFE